MRSTRTFLAGSVGALVPLGFLLFSLGGASCGSSSSGGPANTPSDAGDAGDDADASALPDVVTDTASDAYVAPEAGPVTCTKPPAFSAEIHASHNPDSLRNVAGAALATLPTGAVLVAYVEAVDDLGHYAVWARTIDPTTATAADDERLDVDADQVAAGALLTLSTLDNGAIVAQWTGGAGKRLRVYQHGKWSPEVLGPDGAMPATGADTIAFAGAPDGTVMVSRARGTGAPYSAATVYHPDSGGPRGSWSTPQTLDLDGATGQPTIQASGRPDGSYVVLVWQGSGGPSARTRGPAGAWSTPSDRAGTGDLSGQPAGIVLDDGSVVLTGTEGAGDTREVMWSTWTASAGWTPARLVSKPTSAAIGLVPFRGGVEPDLFRVSGMKLEFVGWVAACATPAASCEFHATTRLYDGTASNPTWADPVDLAIGPTMNGPDFASVIRLEDGHPLVWRGNATGNELDFKVRLGDTWSDATNLFAGPAGTFDGTIRSTAQLHGGAIGLFALVGRVNPAAFPPSMPALMGKVTPGSTPPGAWNPVSFAGDQMLSSSAIGAYVDGAGGFSVASNDANDGNSTIPLLAHDFGNGTAPAIVQVISGDESNASFAAVPAGAPRPGGLDKSAIFLVMATPTGSTTPGRRLRAYAYNGQGTAVVQKQLANETRQPRLFPQSVLNAGCGGAIAYAVDPADGSHALEVVLVQ